MLKPERQSVRNSPRRILIPRPSAFQGWASPLDPNLSGGSKRTILWGRGGGNLAEIGSAYSTSGKRFELRPSSVQRPSRHSVLREVMLTVAGVVWMGCQGLTHDALPNRLTRGPMYIFGPAEQPKARRGRLVEMKKPMQITSGLHLHDPM